MGFFSNLFNWDAAKIESVKEEINILDAINAHVRWKIRLDRCLNGTSEETLDPKVICRDDQCVLGKWIHGPAQKHFHGNEYLNILREHHANFHILASRVVERIQANDKLAAEKILFGDYNEHSRIVIRDLTELGKNLAIDKL